MLLVSIECNYLFNYATFNSVVQHSHKAQIPVPLLTHSIERSFLSFCNHC